MFLINDKEGYGGSKIRQGKLRTMNRDCLCSWVLEEPIQKNVLCFQQLVKCPRAVTLSN